jgi:hypothetical protein
VYGIVQLQSTITFLSLQQWQEYDTSAPGNTQAEKDQLWQTYITELDILKALIQTKRTEEEMIWSAIDSIEIAECLDSISMISMKAYKYMTHMDELSETEKVDIVKYAKKCATQYGHGVHLMRSIASSFDDTDYREYDTECEEAEQEGYTDQDIELRKNNVDLQIIPNPNNGTFIITSLRSNIKRITIQSPQGKIVYKSRNIINTQEIKLNLNLNIGLYILSVEHVDAQMVSKKIVITK